MDWAEQIMRKAIGNATGGDAVSRAAAALRAEREACAAKAREFAAHYPVGSDGRNTLMILAEWIDTRASAQ